MPTPKGVPTRKDVADLAGVSETVVSYVINNNRYVAPEKRERVLKAIEELKYRPSSIARAMKGKGVNAILFICDNMTNEHFGKIVDEMDRLAYDRNYLISLIRGKNDERFVNQVLSHPFGGPLQLLSRRPHHRGLAVHQLYHANAGVRPAGLPEQHPHGL